MHMNFFSNFEYFMYFFVNQFCFRFFTISGLVPVSGVDSFDDRFGSDNIDHKSTQSSPSQLI
jgi:hypothetical protein